MQKKVNVCALIGLVMPIISLFLFLILMIVTEKKIFLWLLLLSGIASFILSVIGLAIKGRYNGSGIADGIIGIILSVLIVFITSAVIVGLFADSNRKRNNSYYYDYYKYR